MKEKRKNEKGKNPVLFFLLVLRTSSTGQPQQIQGLKRLLEI